MTKTARMKIRIGFGTVFVALVFAATNAEAQVETVTAAVGYWNYAANPNNTVVNLVPSPPASDSWDGISAVPSSVHAFGAWTDNSGNGVILDPQVGTAVASANIMNQVVNVPVGYLAETTPAIDLAAKATSTYPTGVGFNGNLPLAIATATISDGLKFCVGSDCEPANLGTLHLRANGATDTLRVTVSYSASLQNVNGNNTAAVGTSLNLISQYGGLPSLEDELVHQGVTTDFTDNFGSETFNFTGLTLAQLSSFEPFEFLAEISADPFEDGSENVTFSDPITLTLLDSDGNVIPNLLVESQSGLFYDITDGALSATSVTPVPAALPLFATGLGGLGLLGWRRKRKARASLLGGRLTLTSRPAGAASPPAFCS